MKNFHFLVKKSIDIIGATHRLVLCGALGRGNIVSTGNFFSGAVYSYISRGFYICRYNPEAN